MTTAEQRELPRMAGRESAFLVGTLIFQLVMRRAGVLSLLAAWGLGCSGADRPDPASLVHPDRTTSSDIINSIPLPPVTCDDFCGETFLHQLQTPPNLYFLVDRSGSMSDLLQGSPLNKYDAARRVLGKLLSVIGYRVRYGASIFPEFADTCGAGHEVFAPTVGGLPSCDGSRDPVLSAFLKSFGDYAPDGATPTAAAIAGVRSELEQLEGSTYLVLLTDGAPNCNFDASCGADQCTLNIEGASVGRQQCTSRFNCCDPGNSGPLAPGECVDADATEQEIARLAAHGIPTYVVGMPGAGAYAEVLDRLAVAGGTARDGDTAYYAADDQAALERALYAIGTGVAIRCTIELETPPDDPDRVNVYFDGQVVPADSYDGWAWDGDARIVVNGDACASLESGDVVDARVVFGCDTVVR